MHSRLGLRTEVRPLDDAWSVLEAGRWLPSPGALSPGSLRAIYPDARWDCAVVLARLGERPVGYLAVHRRRFGPCRDADYDLTRVLGLDGEYAYLGGRHDLAAGVVLADRPGADPGEVRRALLAGGLAEVGRAGIGAAALYVPDSEVADFAAALGAGCVVRRLGSAAVLDLAEPGYPAGLRRSRRKLVRQERRRLEALAMTVTEVPAEGAAGGAAPLIAAVRRGHGLPDHPRLVAHRLGQWLACGTGEHVAFEVRDRAGMLLAVSFGCRAGDRLDMYDIGLVAEHEHRHLAYAAAGVHGPIRHAERHGCTTIHLGLSSSAPKVLRGARLVPVWGLANPGKE
ncbi:GNAT family N-acetyltransferase [Paractinoplanes rishiriensis]|uniref:BioF2-like acetyltransferase domain-containing protein n=1 Tax=Paractinoplanes rishiriensis TaxID=1050105 RepID=A0A919K7F0_9ACTN|nr:GNAT family N-acetyltransferase [Actinoplanes rishiriensis]GIF01025.1 hypothetical protein Ari01nite_84890 [Actinoplanes rishiriensis]